MTLAGRLDRLERKRERTRPAVAAKPKPPFDWPAFERIVEEFWPALAAALAFGHDAEINLESV